MKRAPRIYGDAFSQRVCVVTMIIVITRKWILQD